MARAADQSRLDRVKKLFGFGTVPGAVRDDAERPPARLHTLTPELIKVSSLLNLHSS